MRTTNLLFLLFIAFVGGFLLGIVFLILYFTDQKKLWSEIVYNQAYIVYSALSFFTMFIAAFYLWKNNFFSRNDFENKPYIRNKVSVENDVVKKTSMKNHKAKVHSENYIENEIVVKDGTHFKSKNRNQIKWKKLVQLLSISIGSLCLISIISANNQLFSEVLNNTSLVEKIVELLFLNIPLLYLFIVFVENKIHIYNKFNIYYKILIYFLVAFFCAWSSLWVFRPDYADFGNYYDYNQKAEFFSTAIFVLFITLIIIPLTISSLTFLKNSKKIWCRAMNIVCRCYIAWKGILLIGIFIYLCLLGSTIYQASTLCRVIIVTLSTLSYTSLIIFIHRLLINLYSIYKEKKYSTKP